MPGEVTPPNRMRPIKLRQELNLDVWHMKTPPPVKWYKTTLVAKVFPYQAKATVPV